MPRASRRRPIWLLLIQFLITAGCSSNDERLADLSRQSLERQAEQNRLVEANNRQVVDATQKLVEADAQARRENSQLQQQIQAERAGVNQQRDTLEQERRDIADQRNRDPVIAESIRAAVGLLVAVLPLVVAVYLLRALFHRSDDEAMADLLVEELLQQHPLVATAAELGIQSNLTNQLPTARSQPSRLGLTPQCNHLAALGTNFKTRVIVHVEGAHDIEFLRRMSHGLNHHDPSISDLTVLESDGRLEFLSASSSLLFSVAKSQPADFAEFYLYDREDLPVTAERIRIVDLLNQRPNCLALLTSKRAIENYLHPEAIREAGGVEVTFGDIDDVAKIVAKATFIPVEHGSWESLSRRARRRLRDKSKKWLNRDAVDRMTPQRLAERDPTGEVIGWLRSIAELATDSVGASA